MTRRNGSGPQLTLSQQLELLDSSEASTSQDVIPVEEEVAATVEEVEKETDVKEEVILIVIHLL